MSWNIQYNGIVIVKHDENTIDVLQESYYIILSEDVYNRFILKFFSKYFI